MTTHTRIDRGGTQTADRADVLDTHVQIRGLVSELADLARTEVERAEFYREALDRLVSAMAAVGGAVWAVDEKGQLALEYQINLRQVGLPTKGSGHEAHARLLSKALASSEGLVVSPNAGSNENGEAANPTGSLIILAPLVSHQRRYGVIEIFQRPVGGAVMHRGFLRFVLEVCDLASNFLKRRELEEYASRQALWGQMEDFCRALYGGLEVRQVALVAANEGRRLVGCDRLSVAVMRGRNPRITSISGQDTFDRRSSAVRLLDRLVRAAIISQEPIWYTGDTSDLPPQIEKILGKYVETAEHSKAIGVLPLIREPAAATRPANGKKRRGKVVGALVVEQFQQARLPEDMLERLDVVRQHATLALGNAQEHNGLFLMPLWRALGSCRAVVAARSLSIAALVACIAGLAAVLTLVPVDFDIEARGTLQPVVRREIFVRESGVVATVLVDHAQKVSRGEALVDLRNRDLEVSVQDLLGRRAATEEQVTSLRRTRNDSRLNFEEQNRLAGQIKQLEKTIDSYSRQLELLNKKQQLLKLTSPIDGQVVTWDVRNALQERPVEKGQIVMSVADTSGPWQLELHVRENRAGYVARVWQEAQAKKQSLPVQYILATGPGRTLEGRVEKVDTIAEVRGDEGNTVLTTVAIDRTKIEAAELRPGASVTARVHCGRRALGFVWFHELFDAVRSRVLFRI